ARWHGWTFFKGEAESNERPPNGDGGHGQAESVADLGRVKVGILGDEFADAIDVWVEASLGTSSTLSGLKRAGLAVPLHESPNEGGADGEAFSDLRSGFTGLASVEDPLTQIEGNGCHRALLGTNCKTRAV